MTRFRTDLPALAPEYMRGPELDRLLSSIGAQLDATAEQVLWARLQTIPLSGGARLADGRPIQCEPFVLPILAAQRGIPLYATEPEYSQRWRLAHHKQLHRRRGTHLGELQHVQPYFLGPDGTWPIPRMRIVHQTGSGMALWHTLEPDGRYQAGLGSNWNFDGCTAQRSRWWAILYRTTPDGTPVPALSPAWTLGDGTDLWGGAEPWAGVRAAVVADLVAMFSDWSSAHSVLWGLILCDSPTDLDPAQAADISPEGWTTFPRAGNWGWLIDPTTNLGTRNPSCHFLFDKGHG